MAIETYLERVPPQNLEAEIGVLGSMLLDTARAEEVASTLHPEQFYAKSHQVIFAAVRAVLERGGAVDVVTIQEELSRRGALDRAGGTEGLARIVEQVPTAANAEHYAGIVRERALLRRLIDAAGTTVKEAFESAAPAAEILDRAEQRIFELADASNKGTTVSIRDLLQEVFAQIDRRDTGRGVRTGFVDLDGITTGLQPGDFIILAARPSMGKSTLAMNIALQAAVREGVGAAIFTLEMSKEQVAKNMLCASARVDSHRLRRGMLAESDRERLLQAAGEIHEAPIFIDDTSSLSPLGLRSRARRLVLQHQVRLIIVDYLQLMAPPHAESRQQEVAQISRSLKALARELDCPIVALSQLSRAVEDRPTMRPRLSDLRESGALEQDADVVLLLWREAYGKTGKEEAEARGKAELIVAKQRNGPTGVVPLTFLKEFMRFESRAYEADETTGEGP